MATEAGGRRRLGSLFRPRLPWTVGSAQRPIGVFDSGVGGVSILRELRRLMPDETVVYVADRAWAPYGGRSLEEVRDRCVAVTDLLLVRGAKMVVVACNSASAAALHHLRELHPDVPFVGMEPAVKPAAAVTNGGVVGVLATAATFQGELYASVLDRHAAGVEVVESAAFGLAEAIEEGRTGDAASIVRKHVSQMRAAGVDTIVLGCTHYGFVADLIAQEAGPTVRIVDPSSAVARQVVRVARKVGLNRSGSGTTTYLATADPGGFADRLYDLVGFSSGVSAVEI
ncbi:MAG: glutamate racemase [Acidimicrobiia bacterium]